MLKEVFKTRKTLQPLKVKTLAHFTGGLPRYETPLSSGFDVRAQISEVIRIKPGERALIPTALAFEIPEGFELQVRPRSGLALKKGISIPNSPGTIDADYRGELQIIVMNLGKEDFVIENQDRIAQVVLCPVIQARFIRVDEVGDTQRGASGFGSTGAK